MMDCLPQKPALLPRLKTLLVLGRALPAAGIVLLAGCMVGPDYQEPVTETPSNWHVDLAYSKMTEDSLTDLAWTDIFRDEQLRSHILTALENN